MHITGTANPVKVLCLSRRGSDERYVSVFAVRCGTAWVAAREWQACDRSEHGSGVLRGRYGAVAGYPFRAERRLIGADHFVTQYRMSAATPDGRRIVCEGADVFAVEDGFREAQGHYLDWPAIQQQLGADTASIAAI
jgi:hypothetical protein